MDFSFVYEKARVALQLLDTIRNGTQSDEADVQVINEFMSMLTDPQQVGIEKILVAVEGDTNEGWRLAVNWARSVYGDDATDLAIKSLKL